MTYDTDRIERDTVIRAPRSRVWQALAQLDEFGQWFGVAFQGKEFRPGAQVHGQITTPGYEHLAFDAWVERVEPEHLLSFRWYPGERDPGADETIEPTTRVTFELSDVADGTWVRVSEVGFDALPPSQRLQAFRMNSQGWDEQMLNIARHVEAAVLAP